MRYYNRRKYFIVLILIAIFMTLGFSVLSSNLSISGTTTVDSSTWDVHFDNLENSEADSSFQYVAGTESIIDDTTVNFSVTLNKPGDRYKFSFDIVNDGAIDAMISSIINPELTEEQQNLINYSIYYTYMGLTPVEQFHKLGSGFSKTITIYIYYYDDVEASDLPSSPINIDLSYSLKFTQADDRAFYPSPPPS